MLKGRCSPGSHSQCNTCENEVASSRCSLVEGVHVKFLDTGCCESSRNGGLIVHALWREDALLRCHGVC